jgi:hypothetical protein
LGQKCVNRLSLAWSQVGLSGLKRKMRLQLKKVQRAPLLWPALYANLLKLIYHEAVFLVILVYMYLKVLSHETDLMSRTLFVYS